MQQQVKDFHLQVTKQNTSPSEPMLRADELRAALIVEEALEAAVATVGFEKAMEIVRKTLKKMGDRVAVDPKCGEPSLVGALGEYADLLYVTFGSFEDAGVDGEPFFEEIHRANMMKVGAQVGSEPAGKMLKPEGWCPPDIKGVLAKMIEERECEARFALNPSPGIDDVTPEQWRGWSEIERHIFNKYWGKTGMWFSCMRCGFPTVRGQSACVSCVPTSKFSDDPELNALAAEVKRLMDEGKISRYPSREEKISWVYGNCKLSNENVTREMVEAAVDEAERKKQ
jgi:predicted HAD superfamily Cof-like phosphohydrolase